MRCILALGISTFAMFVTAQRESPPIAPSAPATSLTTQRAQTYPIRLNAVPAAPMAPIATVPPSAINPPSPFSAPASYAQQVPSPYSSYPVARSAGSKEERALQKQINIARNGLASDDAEVRNKSVDDLKEAVAALFEVRSKSREKQIKELEERLAKLRTQMEEREDKKSDIIRLHVQTMVNQANGLGF